MLINGSSPLSHGLLHFDLNRIPEYAEIDEVTLTLLIHSGMHTNRYILYLVTAPWDEDSATWMHAMEGALWNVAGGDYQLSPSVELTVPASLPNWIVADITAFITEEQGHLNRNIADNGFIIKADTQFSKIVAKEFADFAKAETCHSCHGNYPPILDEGKSTSCEWCHAHAGMPLYGEPTLVIHYHIPDVDGDAIADELDNCPADPNSNQEDNDMDGTGDVCDPDDDNDTITDITDNCQYVHNAGQEESHPPEGNSCGDACECEGDFDGDEDVDGIDAAACKADFGRSALERPCTSAHPCNGDFLCDSGVDGSDAVIFKADFGRSAYFNRCPSCITVPWCMYP
jgi:hypothetical protein